jgi:hypothetical protein
VRAGGGGRSAAGWNLLGLVDFVLAITAAFASMAPFVAQLAGSGTSLSYLNYPFLIPSFGVPVFGLLHIYSLLQLRWAAQRTQTMRTDTIRGVAAPWRVVATAAAQEREHAVGKTTGAE